MNNNNLNIGLEILQNRIDIKLRRVKELKVMVADGNAEEIELTYELEKLNELRTFLKNY